MNNVFNEIYKLQIALRDISLKDWAPNELFKWNWWVGISVFIIPIIVCWILIDKKRILDIVLFGCLVSLITNFLDIVGHDYGLWDYPILLLPNIHHFIEVDSSALPVAYMLIYQYFPSWKKFIIANIIMAAISAFIIEPLFVFMKLYEKPGWKYIYSFPIYIILAILCRFLMNKMKKIHLSNM